MTPDQIEKFALFVLRTSQDHTHPCQPWCARLLAQFVEEAHKGPDNPYLSPERTADLKRRFGLENPPG